MDTVSAVLFATLTVAVITDLLWQRVPNWLTLPMLIAGVVFQFATAGAGAAGMALVGALLGFALLIGFYAMGGMGAGDVKLLAAVGAWVGPGAVCAIFLITGVAGGLYSMGLLVAPALAQHGAGEAIRRGMAALRTVFLTGQVTTIFPARTPETKLRYAVCIAVAVAFVEATVSGQELTSIISDLV